MVDNQSMTRRKVLKMSGVMGASSIALSGSSVASIGSGQSGPDSGIIHVTDDDDSKYYTTTIDKKRYVISVEKETGAVKMKSIGRAGSVQVAEDSIGPESADRTVSVKKASSGVEIIKRSDGYRRPIGSCSLDCNRHWITGVSIQFAWWTADVAQSVIAGAIVSAIAASGLGAVAAYASHSVVKSIISSLSSGLMGNTLTIGVVDFDLNYGIGKKKMAYGGYALGPWQPDPPAIIPFGPDISGHGPDCDW